MTPDEICLAAAQGLMPDSLDQPGQALFTTMRRVYADYADGIIGRDTGAAEKRKAIAAYSKAKSIYDFMDKWAADSARIHRATESAKAEARKNPCAETALRLADAIDGLMKE